METEADLESGANTAQIKLALFMIKKLLSEKKYRFIERQKNLETLAQLAMLPEDIIEEINSLTCEDYCSGPSDDRNSAEKNCIWEFGKQIDDVTVYIKIKLTVEEVLTISFHTAERELRYHYKEK